MKEKPRLVDYSLLEKKINQKKIIKPIHKAITKNDNSLLINFIGIIILCIGGLLLYKRLLEKENNDLLKKNLIIGLNEYVKENII